jgi:hypothetical protein
LLLFAPLAAVLIGAFIVNLRLPFHPVQWERLLLIGLPLYLLLVAAGLARLAAGWPVAGMALLALLCLPALAALGRFYAIPRYEGNDYRPVAARVAALGVAGDAVIAVYPWQAGFFQIYGGERGPATVLAPAARWAGDADRRRADLAALLAAHPRLWLPAFQIFGHGLEDALETDLAEMAYPATNNWYGNTRLLGYATAAPDRDAPAADFGGKLRLGGARYGPERVESGAGAVAVALTWTPIGAPDAPYTVHLRLTDAKGRTWAQRDSAPAGGLHPTTGWSGGAPVADRHALFVPAGTPPGVYEIRLSVSGPAGTLDALREGVLPRPELGLGTVEVTPARALARPETLAVGERLTPPARLDPAISLLGYSLGDDEWRAGGRRRLSLFFRAEQAPATDWPVVVELRATDGSTRAARAFSPVDGAYPTGRWPAGAAVRDQIDFLVPPELPAGEYRLAVRLGEGPAVSLATVAVAARPHRFAAPPMETLAGARFGAVAELTGYDLAPAGGALALTLYWRSLAATEEDYSVFVHLLDGGGRVAAQVDRVPGAGEFPTPSWAPGEFLTDAYSLALPAGFRGGALEVGLYDPLTGARLPVTGPGVPAAGADSLILTRVEGP